MNLVDVSNIECDLYLTMQLTELGIPVVIALNMMNIVRKNGDRFDVRKLSEMPDCKLVEKCARYCGLPFCIKERMIKLLPCNFIIRSL